ncbi:MAG TPA: hypothetical protein VFN61_01045, partial [Acidimicrobiales bacterium]|nr:hypothetical protein [Acidimicrobiales bacterium]
MAVAEPASGYQQAPARGWKQMGVPSRVLRLGRAIRLNKPGAAAIAVLTGLFVVALAGPYLVPHNPLLPIGLP